MANPWLQIPAFDYENHMRSSSVGQQSFLARIFKESLSKHDCSSIALLGCATGNGLEYIVNEKTRRITAIDINPEYLEILRKRYERRIPKLEVVEADLEIYMVEKQAYSLIFAGLIFEYLEPQKLLRKIAAALLPGGVMVCILQLPAEHLSQVSETGFTSLKALNSIMKLVTAQQFKAMAHRAGLREAAAKTVTLESGKPFYIGTYSSATALAPHFETL